MITPLGPRYFGTWYKIHRNKSVWGTAQWFYCCKIQCFPWTGHTFFYYNSSGQLQISFWWSKPDFHLFQNGAALLHWSTQMREYFLNSSLTFHITQAPSLPIFKHLPKMHNFFLTFHMVSGVASWEMFLLCSTVYLMYFHILFSVISQVCCFGSIK